MACANNEIAINGSKKPHQPEKDSKRHMKELVRTNNAVLITFIEALMKEAGIRFFVADQNMSIVEGSLGILPRRIMVDPDDLVKAERIIREAGIAGELKKD